ESRVEQGNDGDRRQGNADLDDGLGGERSREDGDQQTDTARELPETERTHSRARHPRAAAGGEPQPNARLAHAATPDDDECGGGDSLDGLWGGFPRDGLYTKPQAG